MGLSHGNPCRAVPGHWGQGQWGSRTLPGAATTPGRVQGWDGKGKAEGKGKKKKERKGQSGLRVRRGASALPPPAPSPPSPLLLQALSP